MVELANIQKPEPKDVILTVRTTKENKKWMDKNNISPSLFFDEAIIDLKRKMKKNVNREECVVCGKPSQKITLGPVLDTTSFCCKRCFRAYTEQNPQAKFLEVKGSRVYVK